VNELRTKLNNTIFGLSFKYYMLHDTVSRTEGRQQHKYIKRHDTTRRNNTQGNGSDMKFITRNKSEKIMNKKDNCNEICICKHQLEFAVETCENL
jgi:hypothetical protein